MFTAIAIDNPGTIVAEFEHSGEFGTFEEAVAWCRSTGRTTAQIFDSVGMCGGWTISVGAWQI